MEKQQFDPSKPVQTRDGRKARILCTDKVCDTSWSPDVSTIVALVMHEAGVEIVNGYYEDGRRYRNNQSLSDLVNVPEKKFEYYRMWRDDLSTYTSRYPALSEEIARANKGFGPNNYIGILEVLVVDKNVVSTRFIPW